MSIVDCFGLSDVGQTRENNEDQFLIADLKKSVIIHQTSLSYDDETELLGNSRAKLLLVADGVGGNAGGERASALAIESVVQYLLNAMHWIFRLESEREPDFFHDLRAALEYSQQKIQHAAEGCHAPNGMGTTITMAYLVWPNVYLVHVGDSRAYVFREGRLNLLTHDQTLAQVLADEGVIEASQVDKSRFSHVLSSLLGCDPRLLNPQIYKSRLQMHDKLLLCTDGLTRNLDDATIEVLLAEERSAESSCERLIRAANAAGGHDNITVVLANFLQLKSDPAESVRAAQVQTE